jgi:ABC-type oligopeptide transport system substrate-binding subunit
MNFKKGLSIFSLAAASLLAVTACGKDEPVDPVGPVDPYVVPTIDYDYARRDDAEVYEEVLGQYATLAEEASEIVDDDERFLKYAEAEAHLLNSGAFLPMSTKGGTYQISRVAPRTVPYAKWGNDEDRLKGAVVIDSAEFIKPADRTELLAAWKTAVGGGAAYNPKQILGAKGYTFKNTYTTTYSTAPVTLDILNTSEQSDTEVLVNTIDGLLEYDNLGNLRGNIAIEDATTGLPYDLSEDGLTYTFHLREDAKWYTADKTEYAPVIADDFVAGFQHMLDAKGGLEWLVQGVVVGVNEYLKKTDTDFSHVGVKAVDDHTFEIKLVAAESFFPTRLTYSCFMPMNRQFFISKGGAFGVDAYAAAAKAEGYKYGVVDSAANMVYNGAFIPGAIVNKSQIVLSRNTGYFKNAENNFNSITWVYDDGKNPDATYNSAIAGTYNAVGLGVASGLLAKAKADGNFAKYAYVTDTDTTTYICGFNVNRGTFKTGSVQSTQSNQEKVYTNIAMNNVFFRKALQFAFNRTAYNAVSAGEELAPLSLRNMYTDPNFLKLGKDVEDDYGYGFKNGTTYGELVQHYVDKLGLAVTVADGQDGWYNPDLAKGYMVRAVKELKAANKWGGKIKIDVTDFSGNPTLLARNASFKASVEEVLGDYVEVCINDASTMDDFYACGYRASDGVSGNFDVFYGSGWGPDYGDPSTYLDTMAGGGAGYMTKILGLF